MENALSGNTTSSRLRNLNTAFNSNIDDAAAITNALSNKTTKQAITSTLKDVGNDILHGVKAEWTEGVEEAINYIASQDGLYNGKKYLIKIFLNKLLKIIFKTQCYGNKHFGVLLVVLLLVVL